MPRAARRHRQRGIALIALMAVVALTFSWILVTKLNAASGDFVAAKRARNAQVLNQAKQALIGHVALQAAKASEDDPGRLPCPENASQAGTSLEGSNGTGCTTAMAIGRLPWRTLGMDKPVDADGQALWLVVSAGWVKPNSGANLNINSNSTGSLNVDNTPNAAVALLIAPGVALSGQTRTATGVNYANYLESYDSATLTFRTTGASGAFNDQVVMLTVADIMPALEAAIASRIEREIVPQLKTVYASGTWATNVSASQPMYPFPAPFGNPSATTSFQGSAASCSGGACQGLMPVVSSNPPGASGLCTPSAGMPCDPMFVRWSGGTIEVKSIVVSGLLYLPGTIAGTLTWTPPVDNCTVATVPASGSPQTTRLDCTVSIPGISLVNTTNVVFEVRANAANVGMALRTFDPTQKSAISGGTVAADPTVAMQSSGTAIMTFTGTTSAPDNINEVVTSKCGLSGILPGFTVECRQVSISVPFTFFPDHPLLNSNHPTWGWFMRNEWYRVLYYATAQGHTASALPASPSCTAGTTCLTVANMTTANNKRSLFLLAGRSLTGTAGANRAIADFLDTTVNRDMDAQFEMLPVNRTSNDRFVVIDAN